MTGDKRELVSSVTSHVTRGDRRQGQRRSTARGKGKFQQTLDIAHSQCRKDGIGEAQANSAPARPVVGPDQEVWVRERILTAMRMALAVRVHALVRADDPAYLSALQGIANGAAVEVIHTLDLEPGYVNLRKVPLPLTLD